MVRNRRLPAVWRNAESVARKLSGERLRLEFLAPTFVKFRGEVPPEAPWFQVLVRSLSIVGYLQPIGERGVEREHVYTYREIRRARKVEGYDEWAEGLARRVMDGAAKVWVALDPDVLNLGSTPDFGAEPLGPTLDEVVELLYRVGCAAGKERLGGISIMATPQEARSLHQAMIYVLLYTLAGAISGER